MNTVFKCCILIFFFVNGYTQSGPSNRLYKIWDDKPSSNRGSDYSQILARGYPYDKDWEGGSYPIGNGYMGANIFGRTDVERIQLSDKTMAIIGPYDRGGTTSLNELYLDMHHYNVQNYKRTLNLNDALLNVEYVHNGVAYTREYFASYPDNVIALKLSANKKESISFTLRGEIPYLRGKNETNTRMGLIHSKDGLLLLSGNVPLFSLNYETQIRILNDGGQIYTPQDNPQAGVRVENANSVIILIAAGTNYELISHVFLEKDYDKKLNPNLYPHDMVSKKLESAIQLGYEGLKNRHLDDYHQIFTRARITLSNEIPEMTTRDLLEIYKKGNKYPFLEELMFNFGKYLLISSSRKGTLPANLQGVWTQYAVTPWSGGYWHNINVQMNYWGAFNTNMVETFIPYIEYFKAYLPQARKNATEYIKKINKANLSGKDDENGWAIGTGANAYYVPAPGGHSGPGTGGFTTKLLWDYYEFTRDTAYLREIAYPALLEMSIFLSKTLKPSDNGLLLVAPSASPEIRVRDEQGKFTGDHYITTGTTFDQGFVWETYNDLLKAAAILDKKDAFIQAAKEQITRLDPILIGGSGQLKEFREEKMYGEIGDPKHRHISHICPLYPGTLINSSKPDWMNAASYVLEQRGNKTMGWALMHRMCAWARLKKGEQARDAFSHLLIDQTLPNLWTLHPPFQIDANLGVVAGVTEMLVQSHEECIELLPALPEAWKTGNFNGLVARGNFELFASWKNSLLTALCIQSNAGEVCSIKYLKGKIKGITDNAGKKIAFSYYKKNVFSFKTTANNKYTITFK